MDSDNLMPVLVTTGVREEKVRSEIVEVLRTQTIDETVKLIEQMVYDKDTNGRIEKKREDSKVASINHTGSAKKTNENITSVSINQES